MEPWLKDELTERLGYCTCSSREALVLLRDFLAIAKRRTDSTSDADGTAFGQATRDLESLLEGEAPSAQADWFVYALDRGGLIQHGFNLYDVLIREPGLRVLQGLDAHLG